jgi:hypothetical protein
MAWWETTAKAECMLATAGEMARPGRADSRNGINRGRYLRVGGIATSILSGFKRRYAQPAQWAGRTGSRRVGDMLCARNDKGGGPGPLRLRFVVCSCTRSRSETGKGRTMGDMRE